MPAHAAQSRPLCVANARRSPSYGCALRLDWPTLDDLLGHAGPVHSLFGFLAVKVALALALLVALTPARADVWAYVDARGITHFAAEQLDARYELFFRGAAPANPGAEAAEAAEAAVRATPAEGGPASAAASSAPHAAAAADRKSVV